MIVLKRQFLVALFCLTLLSAIGRPGNAADEPKDLCAIPFTEGHRAAIEERYLPSLTRLWARWAADDDPKVLLGGYTKTLVEQVRKNLQYSKEKIRSAVTQPGQTGALVSLPSRDGSAGVPAGRISPDIYRAFPITAQEQTMLDEATQAFLHWSCSISDASQFNSVFRFSLSMWGDIFISRSYPLSFHDWRQLVLIVYRQLSANPNPSDEWVTVAPATAWIALFGLFNPTWTSDLKKAAHRQRLQLAVVDWILKSDSDYPDKVRSIAVDALDDWETSPTDPARRIIVQRILKRYVAFISTPELQNLRSDEKKLMDAAVFFHFFAKVRQPNLSRCFFDRFFDLADEIGTQEYRGLSIAERRADFANLMKDAFGSSWMSAPISTSNCLEISLSLIE